VIGTATDVPREAALDLPEEAARDQRLAAVALAVDLAASGEIAGVGRVDPARIAVGGHSYGGCVALNAAVRDSRVAAAFDFDGSVFDAAASRPPRVPTWVVRAGSAGDALITCLLAGSSSAVGVRLAGAGHFAVTDAPVLVRPVPAPAEQLPVGNAGRQTVAATNELVRRFVDASLGRRAGVPVADELVRGVDGASPLGD
jgi:pimeloyl-ACP methyl ester carboxylesterase